MNTLISTFHFLLHKYIPHLSNVLKLSRRFAAQWNLYIMLENIKSTNFILGTNTKSRNLRIHKLVIFNQTTKIDTHKEKYFHSKQFKRVSGKETWSSNCYWEWTHMILIFIWKCPNLSVLLMQIKSDNKTSQYLIGYEEITWNNKQWNIYPQTIRHI